MTPGVLQPDDDHSLERHLTKQMGCITGFFHIFDRHHPIPSKRKRLPPSAVTSPPGLPSPPPHPHSRTQPAGSPSSSSISPSESSPRATPPPAADPPRSSLPVFDFREASGTPWKLRDSPRLSLDSRIPREIRTVRSESDGAGDERRSPSVVARLMGLDALPPTTPELRRSSSSAPRLPSPPPPPATITPSPPRGEFEMLKEILEAMQLKGLLRPRREPIVVVRPARRREMVPDARPRRERDPPSQGKPGRDARRSPPPTKATPVPRRSGSPDEAARSPRGRRSKKIAVEDVTSTFECEREKLEYRNGRRLLERCDKLLHSIAEITEGARSGGVGGGESGRQTSPVSVLDSSAAFYAAESDAAASPPSPSSALKRCLRFEERMAVEETPSCMPILQPMDEAEASDGDFLYVAKVLRVAGRVGEENSFSALEKEHQKSSSSSRLHRRLLYDSVVEIMDKRNNQRPSSPWEAFARSRSPVVATPSSPREIWEELKRTREHVFPTDELYDTACDALREDIVGNGEGIAWSRRDKELSDVVLDAERLIFKDLVAETIRDLAAALNSRPHPPPPPPPMRRKLVF